MTGRPRERAEQIANNILSAVPAMELRWEGKTFHAEVAFQVVQLLEIDAAHDVDDGELARLARDDGETPRPVAEHEYIHVGVFHVAAGGCK